MKVTIYGSLGEEKEIINITVEGDPTADTPEDVAAAYLQVVDKLSEEEE